MASFSTAMSACMRLSFESSASSSLTRLGIGDTHASVFALPIAIRQLAMERSDMAGLDGSQKFLQMPCLRHTSETFIPESVSFKIATIWLSVKKALFMVSIAF